MALNILHRLRYEPRMGDVIHPTFGGRRKPETATTNAAGTEHQALRLFGHAAGYTVALIRDDHTQQGPVLKVVVGPADSSEVEAVAILSATREGDADADVVGMAILRTLELMQTAFRGAGSN